MPSPSPRLALLLLSGLLALPGCTDTKKSSKPKGIGKVLAQTPARHLAVSPDGTHAAFVGEIVPPAEKGAPEGLFQGVLTVVPLAGGTPRQLGGGVTTFEDSFRFSPDSKHLAYLQGFRFRDQSGTLQLAPVAGGDPKNLGEDCKFFRFSPDGKLLAHICQGQMRLTELATGASQGVTDKAATFTFSTDGKRLLVRQPSAAGGGLLLAEVENPRAAKKLGENVGDYSFSADGQVIAYTARIGGPGEPYSLFIAKGDGSTGGPGKVGTGVSDFLFSPDGKWVAFVDGVSLNKSLGNLQVVSTAGGAAVQVGTDVEDKRWNSTSSAIAFRELHEDKAGRKWINFKVARMGTGEPAKLVADNVPNFQWSFDGTTLAFLKRVTKPNFSVNLGLYKLGDENHKEIDRGVFGYQFAPGDRAIWYRTNCIRNGRECDLMSVGPGGEGYPVKIIQSIWTFRPNSTGDKLLITYPRLDTEAAADLGVMSIGAKVPSKGIDQYVLPGAQFTDAQGSKVAYIVTDRKREGVYVADIPAPEAAPTPTAPAAKP